MLRQILPLGLLLLGSTWGALSVAQEWTRFRGPNGTGISDATTIPTTWTDDDYNWIAELPGAGHSSPVVWGERIFLTSADGDGARRYVLCIDVVDGRIVWQRDYDSTPHKKHVRNSFATPTAVVDQDYVFVVWSAPEQYSLRAFDHQGRELWHRDLGPYASQHSCGSSPILFEDMVILGNEQDGDSFLIAVDRQTGQTRWQTPRQTTVVAYSTPCVYQPRHGPLELIFNSGSHGISSVDPWTGQPNWELKVFDKRSVSSPVIVNDLIFGSCGSGGGGNYVVAVKPGLTEGSVAPEEVFRVDRSAPYVPTSVAVGELIFLWSDQGVVTCLNATNGQEIWRKRIGNNFSGSPICVNGSLYCVADDGEVFVLAASENYELLGKVQLDEECRSTPAVADGRLYLRTISHLYSLGDEQ